MRGDRSGTRGAELLRNAASNTAAQQRRFYLKIPILQGRGASCRQGQRVFSRESSSPPKAARLIATPEGTRFESVPIKVSEKHLTLS